MLTEVGSATTAAATAAWVTGSRRSCRCATRVRAVVWFDKAEWRVDSSPATMAAFGRLAASSRFSARPPA